VYLLFIQTLDNPFVKLIAYSSSQEIYRFCETQNFVTAIRMNPSLVNILSQKHLVYNLRINLFQVNLMLPSNLRLCLSDLSDQYIQSLHQLFHVCCSDPFMSSSLL
jgi:hypothetical protein